LTVLDADGERAAQAYEQLRERTIGLLHWWGAADAEDLADLTFDRVARKLEEGATVPPASLPAYVRGVARMIYYESLRRPQVAAQDLAYLAPPPAANQDALGCLDACLNKLTEADRAVVLRYYDEGKAATVRKTLAAELGTSLTALRIRAYRIRANLERCLQGCLGSR